MAAFVARYNADWLIERHGHRTPREDLRQCQGSRSGMIDKHTLVSKEPGPVHMRLGHRAKSPSGAETSKELMPSARCNTVNGQPGSSRGAAPTLGRQALQLRWPVRHSRCLGGGPQTTKSSQYLARRLHSP